MDGSNTSRHQLTKMPLNTHVFDGARFGFPPVKLPLLPTAAAVSVGASGPCEASPVPEGTYIDYARGRYALHAAYQLAGLNPGTALLAPAYHCRTMIDPALRLNAEIAFYSVTESLAPSLALIEHARRKAKIRISALLVTHYFGRVNDLTEIQDWCTANRITLIEDASHALLTPSFSAPGVGRTSDLTVASPYKFFPIDDGGLLRISPRIHLRPPTRTSPSLREEIAALYHGWQKSHYRPSAPDRSALAANLLGAKGLPASCPDEIAPWKGPSAQYADQIEGRRSLQISRLTIRQHDVGAIAAARRKNFSRLLSGLGSLNHGRPLIGALHDGDIPYMFPLLIDHPEPHFFWLKRIGVPIWRWDEQAVTECPTASNYRLQLLHLPCHQSLTEDQLDWMIEAIRTVLNDRAT